LLVDDGGSNLQFKLVYITGGPFSTPQYTTQAQTVASMLNAAGFKVTLGTNDYNKDFVDSGKGSRQGYFDKETLLFGATAGFSDADDWLFGYFDSKSTSNQEHLNDPTYDAMITKERAATTESDRLKAVLDIQKYIADKMYAPSTGATDGWFAVNPRVQNYQYSSSIGKPTETYAKLWIKS
jgi:ABC-type transport system substrate-binding protein